MSKSLYQYKFESENREQIEAMLRQLLPTKGYKMSKVPNTFVCGSGWMTAKRKIEYRIVGDMLSICVWKVIAPIVPMLEMGCNDANSTYGVVLNSGMKAAVENTAAEISAKFPLTMFSNCQSVADNFLDVISSTYQGQ